MGTEPITTSRDDAPETPLSETPYAVSVQVPAGQAKAVYDAFRAALTGLGLPTGTLTAQQAESVRPTEADILTAVRTTLAEAGIDPTLVTRLRFGVSEWDNGYFYIDTPEFTFADEQALDDLDDAGVDPDEVEMQAITSALYDFHGGPLGRHDEAVVDLTANTVEV